MDRRQYARVAVQFEARVTTPKSPNGFWTTVSDISKSGLCVTIPASLNPGDAVRIEMADSVLSGKVAYSNPDASMFRTGIDVQQVQLGGTDLSDLLQRTLHEVMPDAVGLEQVEAHLD
jgi:hypothetical protein